MAWSTSLVASDANTERVEVAQVANDAGGCVGGCNYASQGNSCDNAIYVDRQNHIRTVITSNQCIATNTCYGDGVG